MRSNPLGLEVVTWVDFGDGTERLGIGRESLADFGSRTMPDLHAGGMAMDGSGTARLATTARNVAK